MAPRKRNESASWELDADKPKPEGSTRIRRSYATKELATREFFFCLERFASLAQS